MNIKDASEQIRDTIRAYLSRDAHGLLRIPFRMQRPIFMSGPPGVGKTAIAAQIANELDINFVSYSITHHTRQSALGLPFIADETFNDEPYRVSEYTMSEIIAAVYRAQKTSGVARGVLFLDEVNCVSETLAPAMLQFLQYKTFGMHRLPEGWVIVCAGNPPEYNRAAREFDPAMLDRLMRIDIEPDLTAWQEYAASHGVHAAVTTYLDAKPGSFYCVRAAARGSRIVTPRGWEDVSRMLKACEAEGIAIPPELPSRYLQDADIAQDFSAYYELFVRYQGNYRVTDILDGTYSSQVAAQAQAAPFDERVAMIGMLVEAMCARAHDAIELAEALDMVRNDILSVQDKLKTVPDSAAVIAQRIHVAEQENQVGQRLEGQVGAQEVVLAERVRALRLIQEEVARCGSEADTAYQVVRDVYNVQRQKQIDLAKAAARSLDASFDFIDSVFGEEAQEALIYVTKLYADPAILHLVRDFGSEQFIKHNQNLLFTERTQGLLKVVELLQEAEED